jgi:hypothetical protein
VLPQGSVSRAERASLRFCVELNDFILDNDTSKMKNYATTYYSEAGSEISNPGKE